MANTDDIRTTGPVGLKGLSAEQRERIRQSRQMATQTYLGRFNPPVQDTSEVQRYSPDEAMASWGTSRYDNPVQSSYLTEDMMQDTRHENQAWYDQLANGTVKMLGTAGTTFLSSLVGLPAGIVTAVDEGRWSGLWDNAVTDALSGADEWLEENFKNYKSTEQENAPWYSLSNLGSMSFWADDVIKNMGFTLGAAASMAVGSGSLGLLSKSLGIVNKVGKGTKMASNFVSSLFSATGEGMIEAKQGVDERNKAELAHLENDLMPERQALEEEYRLINEEYAANKGQMMVTDAEGRAVDPAYEKYKQQMNSLQAKRDELQKKYEAGKQYIEESGRAMGNKILLGNQVLLTAGNLIQFSKGMTKSFDRARHAAEQSSKSMKPSWFRDGFNATRRSADDISKGYDMSSKAFGVTRAATKGLLTEGSEEMNQQWIQSGAGAYYNRKDANDYWKAKLDQKAFKETSEELYGLGNAISQGFSESWGDVNQWEQFLIGGMTGMAGSYMPSKIFNQDKTKSRWNPLRYGSWEGGAYNDVRDFLNGTDEHIGYNQYKENIDALNDILASKDFFGRVQNLAAHTYSESKKAEYAANNDKKAWKDEDDKQTIRDIQAFLRAGKLDDLRAIYDEIGADMSDDDIQEVIRRTTREISTEQDKKNHDDAIDEQIAGHRKTIDDLKLSVGAIVPEETVQKPEEAPTVEAGDYESFKQQWKQQQTGNEEVSRENLQQQLNDLNTQIQQWEQTARDAEDAETRKYAVEQAKSLKEEKKRLSNPTRRNKMTGYSAVDPRLEEEKRNLRNSIDNKEKQIQAHEMLLEDADEESRQELERDNDYIEKLRGEVADERKQLADLESAETSKRRGVAYSNEQKAAPIEDVLKKIEAEEEAIRQLEEEKANYQGQVKYEGAFVDSESNQTTSNEDVRKELKHNSEEMQRKLDSYLDSIDEVNRRTNGKLTKDQEDNLAYLHNLGKESINRADKIMKDVRKSLPKKFLLKTNKSPEQLAQENASSDLAFTKSPTTPEGYVEVDTGLLNDHVFTDFFIRDILWGGNIRPEFGETADEKAIREEEEKNLSEEEKKKRRAAGWKKAYENAQKDAKEQNQTNAELMVNNFLENYRKDNRATEKEALDALSELLENVADAATLVAQAGEYEKTLSEYMAHPERVDEDKAKEEKKAEKKSKKERVKEKLVGKSVPEITQEMQDGTIDLDDIGALYEVDDEEDPEIAETKEKVKKVEEINKKRASLKSKIQDQIEDDELELADDAIFDEIEGAIDRVAANAESDVELDYDTIFNEIQLDNPDDLDTAGNLLAAALEAHQEDEDAKDDIPEITPEEVEEPDETGHDKTTQLPGKTATPQVEKPKNDGEWEQPLPINNLTPGARNKVAEELSQDEEASPQNGAWRNATRRYGRQPISARRWGTAKVPYHELAKERNPLLAKRSEAIWNYLNSDTVNAWDHVDSVEGDKIEAGKTVIHFMVKNFTKEIFGENAVYEDLKDEEKEVALVILMVDDNGRILGDLPLAKFEPTYEKPNETKAVKELKATQKLLFDAFLERREKTGCDVAVADKSLNISGTENLGLTFNSRRPFVSKISQILTGVAPFGDEINTLNDIMGDGNLKLGISVTGEIIATSKSKKNKSSAKPLRTANIGQPYILIPSPSGVDVPVPFYTKPFDVSRHSGTQLYKILCEALANLVNNAGKSETSTYKESIDVLEGLLQVRAQEGVKSTVEVKKDTVTIHLQSLIDASQKINITVPNTNNGAEAAAAIAEKLNGTKINISLQFINSKIGVRNGTSAEYNKVIGEIADANLPKNTAHTVNNGFLIKLTNQAGTQKSEVRYQQSGTQTFSVGEKTVKVDMDKLIAYQIDPATKEETEITGDEEVNLLLARIKAQQTGKTEQFKIKLDGKVRTFDPKKGEFVKTSEGSGVNAGQKSINQQKEERKNAPAPQPAPKTIFNTSTVENKQGAKILSKGMLIADKAGDASTYTTGTVGGKKVFYPSAPLAVVRTSANQQSFFLMDKSTATATEAGGYVVYEPGEYEERNGAIVVTKEAKIGYYKNSPDELVGKAAGPQQGKKEGFFIGETSIDDVAFGSSKKRNRGTLKAKEKDGNVTFEIDGHKQSIKIDNKDWITSESVIEGQYDRTIGTTEEELEKYGVDKNAEFTVNKIFKSPKDGKWYAEGYFLMGDSLQDGKMETMVELSPEFNLNNALQNHREKRNARYEDAYRRAQQGKPTSTVSIPTMKGGVTREVPGFKIDKKDIKKGDIIGYTGPEGSNVINYGTIETVQGDDVVIVTGFGSSILPSDRTYYKLDLSSQPNQQEEKPEGEPSGTGADKVFKGPESREDHIVNTIVISTTGIKKGLKKDIERKGKYEVNIFDDGFIEGKYRGPVTAQRHIILSDLDDIGLVIEDVAGDIKSGSDFSEVQEEFKEDGAYIERIVIRPDNSLYVEWQGGNFTVPSEKSETFVNKYFPELKEVINNRQEGKASGTVAEEKGAEKPEVPIMEYWDTLEVLGEQDVPKALREAGYSEEEIQEAVEKKKPKEGAKEGKTIEDIEKEVNEKKIVNSRNQDAWDAIPDALKLKLVNDRTNIVLEYGGKEVSLDYRNLNDLKNKLREANKYAKSGSMSVKEGAKYRRAKNEKEKKADIRKEKEWLQKNLPMFSSQDRLHLIQGLIEIPGEKNWAWGRFEKGIITLSDMAARGTLYHEAFHAVTQTLLSDEELDTLYEAAVKRYKEKSPALVEELLAEDFRRYVQRGETPIIGPILKFFRKIVNAIRNIAGYRAPIQQLFYRINNGEFRESIPREARVGNAFYKKNYRYNGRVEESLAEFDHPLARAVIQSFYNWPGLTGSAVATGNNWSNFKNYWKQKHVTVVGAWRDKATGIRGYALNEIWVDMSEGMSISMSDFAEWDADRRKRAERNSAIQAIRGAQEAQQWRRLSRSQIEALREEDITKELWDNMSVEEQRQWLECHS